MKIKYLFLICLFSLLFVSFGFSQSQNLFQKDTLSWKLLLDAEQAFYKREYGTALKLANAGLVNRKTEVAWSLGVLENATKTFPFHSKDDLDEIYKMILERNDSDAILLLESILMKHGFDFFENSFQKLFSFIESQKEYPELYFLIAKIYMIEGEWALAEEFYLKAYDFQNLLLVPTQKYEILYALFDLYTLTKNSEKQEKTLLLVIADDPHFSQEKNSTRLFHTASRAIQTKTELNKFFLLYHSSSLFAMKAYFELANIYAQDEKNKTLVLQLISLASITAYERIETIIKKRAFDYGFESFDTLLRIATKYDDILDWMQKENVWAIFFQLAQSAKENNNHQFAKSLLIHMSNYCPDSYWKKRAVESYIAIQ